MAREDYRLVLPSLDEPKSGCLWCPLLPWSEDFEVHKEDYQRDGAKIQKKESEGHVVRTRLVSQSWSGVDILFVGEAPGKTEDKPEWGVPFVGMAGKMLRKSLQEYLEIDDDRIGISNVISCRPPRNRKPNKTEVRSCVPRLVREVKARKPQVIVVLGGTALEFFTGHTGILSFQGHVLDCILPELEHIPIVACVHPAYVLRYNHEVEKFTSAIKIAADVLSGDYEAKSGEGEYTVLDTPQAVEAMVDRFLEEDKPVAFDTETGSLTPFQSKFPRLLCFSFCNAAGVAYAVPFDHAESPFRTKGKARKRVAKTMCRFFLDPIEKTAQNEKFDRNHIRRALGVEPANVKIDTMNTHYVLDELPGTHGLKRLAYAHTGMGGYDRKLDDYISEHPDADPDRGGSYANIPGAVLFPYAAMDADVNLRVRTALLANPELKKGGKLYNLATHLYPALSEALADLEYSGAQVDPEMVKYLERKYLKEMARQSKLVRAHPAVKRFLRDRGRDNPKKEGEPFNPGSSTQLREVLFDYMGERPTEMTDTGFSRLKQRFNNVTAAWSADKKPMSVKGKRPSFKSVYDGAIAAGEWEFFSTKADVLHQLERGGNDLVEPILAYRAVDTLRGTFVAPLLGKCDGNNRVHGTFLTARTVTARLASRDPNLQNIPNKGGGMVKRCYVSRFGDQGIIIQGDYGQIELRVAASYFNEPVMLKVYRDPKGDMHYTTALDIARVSKVAATEAIYLRMSEAVQKEWRTRAKRTNFGSLYGGGPPALITTLRKDGVYITEKEAKELLTNFFKARPALRKGIDALGEKVRRDGYLESFTGHRRRIPEVWSGDEQLIARAIRQSVNFPIQNSAAQMTNMAMVLVHREFKRLKLRSKLILTVHDSIGVDTHIDEVQIVAHTLQTCMESIRERSDEVLPGLKWGWFKCSIVCDLEAGYTWGTMVEFKKLKLVADDLDIDVLWGAMDEAAA